MNYNTGKNTGKAIRISVSVGKQFHFFQIVDVIVKDGIEVITLFSSEYISLKKEGALRRKYSKCGNMYSLEQKYLLEKRDSGEKIILSEHQVTIYYLD